jgi:hypothetical protein
MKKLTWNNRWTDIIKVAWSLENVPAWTTVYYRDGAWAVATPSITVWMDTIFLPLLWVSSWTNSSEKENTISIERVNLNDVFELNSTDLDVSTVINDITSWMLVAVYFDTENGLNVDEADWELVWRVIGYDSTNEVSKVIFTKITY